MIRAAKYCLLDGKLYKISNMGPLLRFNGHESSFKVMVEMHERHCGNHSCEISMSRRVMLHDYYLPTLFIDLEKYVRECNKCQKFAPLHHILKNELSIVSSPWPFIQWGLDIIGPLPQTPPQKKFILEPTYYFSK